jgi:division protein CdvB (Snf7/Vps24/ESCRT-III family)
MERKPRRPKVQNIIKNLLDSEIPEIQSMANKLAEQIKDLEEQSSRLQEYVIQIEHMATDEANTLAESRIAEILKDLDAALKELRRKPKRSLAGGTETRAVAIRRPAEENTEGEEEAEETGEKITPTAKTKLETIITPEGYIVKKARY